MAKLCRNVWQETRLTRPAFATASFIAFWTMDLRGHDDGPVPLFRESSSGSPAERPIASANLRKRWGIFGREHRASEPGPSRQSGPFHGFAWQSEDVSGVAS